MGTKGIIFDLDGVITQTAKVHYNAWKQTFQDFLEKKGQPTHFTYDEDYVPYVDGKPRYEGVQSFLESRGIQLPFGSIADAPGSETICGIGNLKNDKFREIVLNKGVELYESTIDLVKKAKEKNIKVGVASSSKNCQFILDAVGLTDHFETIVDGNVSQKLNLRGKPQPDIFIKAAENMGLYPNDCVVVEDALAGVKAGQNGNFGLVLGVSRNGDLNDLRTNGGDIIVRDLQEITLDDIGHWFDKDVHEDSWMLLFNEYTPKQERLREALTTVGNGYYGSRGAFESEKMKDNLFYPGTYIAGLFNELPSEVHGKTIYNNDFVNCPNWHLIQFKIGDEEQIYNLQNIKIIDYKHQLNMKNAIVQRMIRCEDQKGRITKIETNRFADMVNPHIGAVKYSITPENYNDNITFISGIDGAIINYGVERYRQLNSSHLETVGTQAEDGLIHLHSRTNASHVDIYMSSRNTLYKENSIFEASREVQTYDDAIYEYISFDAEAGKTYSLEKISGIYTSKDPDIKDHAAESKKTVKKANDFDQLFEGHKKQWTQLWNKANIEIKGDRFVQRVARLHTYHLLVTCSVHNKKIDAGMPARGLHGEAYRGHIFWDELYILPFYNKHFPDVAKALLEYRYRHLDAAKKNAKEHGYEGAMYPWQTADDGKEETQVIHYNPMSDSWGPDLSRRQRHVSIAIAYNMWEYYQNTNDKHFLDAFGGEVIFEICRFWASIAEYDEEDKRYHIRGVMGPDEFHEKYAGKPDDEGGIDDNAYTNILTSWLLRTASELFNVVSDQVKEKLKLSDSEIKKWINISENLCIHISEDGVIEQFKGFFKLKELNWNYYKKKYDNIRRMDRILKAEGDSPDNYQLAKQADTLMPFYLLSPQKIKETLNKMGYDYDDPTYLLQKNYDYYINRTTHGSTLSYVVHSYVLKYLSVDKWFIWDWFISAMKSDIYDTQGGTTLEGIHAGVMAGTLDIIIKNFAGFSMEEKIEISPQLPDHWESISFQMEYKKELFKYTITQETIEIENVDDHDSKLSVLVDGETYKLHGQKHLRIPYNLSDV